MRTHLGRLATGLYKSENAQDLIEYSLLLAFVVLAGAAAFVSMADVTSGLWNTINSRLGNANR